MTSKLSTNSYIRMGLALEATCNPTTLIKSRCADKRASGTPGFVDFREGENCDDLYENRHCADELVSLLSIAEKEAQRMRMLGAIIIAVIGDGPTDLGKRKCCTVLFTNSAVPNAEL